MARYRAWTCTDPGVAPSTIAQGGAVQGADTLGSVADDKTGADARSSDRVRGDQGDIEVSQGSSEAEAPGELPIVELPLSKAQAISLTLAYTPFRGVPRDVIARRIRYPDFEEGMGVGLNNPDYLAAEAVIVVAFRADVMSPEAIAAGDAYPRPVEGSFSVFYEPTGAGLLRGGLMKAGPQQYDRIAALAEIP